ncbi:MAG: FAD-dependent oxidoreductase [Deltaproteobacteria bacterium]|nr:FAD-dependent oxidoreductase [Deltaproteobacteria bacterium]
MPTDSHSYDLLVIGGGISGLGIAYEGARRGLDTVLLEKGTCCRATSDNSMRIIHGGLRYLQSLDIRRTLESLRAQSDLLLQYSSFVKPLACVMPLGRFGLKSRWPVWAGIQFYNQLASWVIPSTMRAARIIAADEVDRRIDVLKGQAPYGALVWHDAIVPQVREFALRLQSDAASYGAKILEGCEVLKIKRQGEAFEVSLRQAQGLTAMQARVLVDASGPWLGRIPVEPPFKRKRAPRGWTKAFNIILNKQVDEVYAIGVSGGRGRLFFTTPREKVSVIGTFHHAFHDNPDNLTVSEQEISEALCAYQQAMPRVKLSLSDVSAVEAGVLPIKRDRPDMPVMYGVEQIHDYDGQIEVLSTKYTTFQVQARRVIEKIVGYGKGADAVVCESTCTKT